MSSCALNMNDTDECRAVHAAYDKAYLNHVKLSDQIKTLKEGRVAAGAIIGTGLALGAVPAVGWVVGGGVMLFGAFVGTLNHLSLSKARKLCMAEIEKLHALAIESGGKCETEACRISRPTLSCP